MWLYGYCSLPYFVSSSFLPLDLLYFKSVAILMHDISNSLTPTNISNLFASQSNIHSYNTRSSSRGDYYVKHSRLDKQTKSFSRYGVKIWNSLPCEMRQMFKNNFKINVHDTLLRTPYCLRQFSRQINLPFSCSSSSVKESFSVLSSLISFFSFLFFFLNTATP